jgi:hypothetical protein
VLVAAAVCPHPPLLIPDATGLAADDGLGELRDACGAAVGTLLQAESDLLLVVGGAEQSARYPASAAGSLAQYGIPVVTGAGQPVLPESLTIGSWLLRSSAPAALPEVSYQAVSRSLRPADCLDLGRRLAASADRVAMLALGDATAIRAIGVPGAAHQAADSYDSRVAAALASVDTAALAALPPALDDELLVAGRAAWQVLAGATEDQPFSASLTYSASPLGVGYLVACWLLLPRRTTPAVI